MQLNRRALLIAIGVTAGAQLMQTLLGYTLSLFLPQNFLVDVRSLAVVAIVALGDLTLMAGVDAFGGALYVWLHARQRPISVHLAALGGALVGTASRILSEVVSFFLNLAILLLFSGRVSPAEGQGADLWLMSLVGSIISLFGLPFFGLLLGGLGGAVAGLILGRSSPERAV